MRVVFLRAGPWPPWCWRGKSPAIGTRQLPPPGGGCPGLGDTGATLGSTLDRVGFHRLSRTPGRVAEVDEE